MARETMREPQSVCLEVAGCTVHIRRAGHGTPVLFLHGIGSGSGSFWAQFAGLSETHTLIAWDAPGYGRSADPEPGWDLDDYASIASGVVSALGFSSAHIVGVSWGGVIATRIALQQQRPVRSLTLISSTVGRSTSVAAQRSLAERATALRRDGVELWARARVRNQVSPDADQAIVERVVSTAVQSVRSLGFEAAAASLAHVDHTSRLHEIQAPTLILAGGQDHVTGVKEAERLHAGIRRSKLDVVPSGGHLLNQDSPEAVNAALSAHFVAEDEREQEGKR